MISVIIPIHNCTPKRDLKRLYYQLLSLSNQSIPCNVVISTDSNDSEVKAIERIILEISLLSQSGTWVKVIRHEPQYNNQMNLPFLINRGIEATDSEWLLVTGIDFIYRPDYLERLIENPWVDVFTISLVRMIQQPDYSDLKDHWITEWKFPRDYKLNGGGRDACGIQFFHRSFFDLTNGYCENMSGFSALDEDLRNRAKNAGLTLKWLDRHVLHLPHPSGKNPKKASREQMRNWKIRDLLNEHKIIDWKKFRKYPRF